MKKILLLIITIIIFTGCTHTPETPYTPPESKGEVVSFEDVSQEWVEVYGQPEDIYKFKMDGYYSVDYWWWTQGFAVGFGWNTWDDIYGWYVDWTYSFTPII